MLVALATATLLTAAGCGTPPSPKVDTPPVLSTHVEQSPAVDPPSPTDAAPAPTSTSAPPFLVAGLEVISPSNAAGLAAIAEVPASGVVHARFSLDGRRLALSSYDLATRDGSVGVWSLENGEELFTLAAWPGRGPPEIDFSPDGSILSTFEAERSIRLWDGSTGSAVAEISGNYLHAAYSPDWRLLATVEYAFVEEVSKIRVLDASSDEVVASWSFSGMVTGVRFAPDGETLAAAVWRDPGYTARLAVASGAILGTLPRVGGLTYSANGLVAAGLVDLGEWIEVYNGMTWTSRFRLGHGGGATVMAHPSLSPAGDVLAAIDRYRVRLWDAASGKELLSLPEQAVNVRFSPDGRLLAVWDTAGPVTLLGVAP